MYFAGVNIGKRAQPGARKEAKRMALADLKEKRLAVGIKQTLKAVRRGDVEAVYLAEDAEKRVLTPVVRACEEMDVPIRTAGTMQELGRAAEIEVGAAALAVLK